MGAKRSKYPWFHKYIKSRIDETWGWCPERKKAKARAVVGRDLRASELFKCESCELQPLTRKQVEIDHIEPRVPVSGWDGYDAYVERTFVPATELKVLCHSCHDKKSEGENKQRPHRRRAANVKTKKEAC